MYSSSLRTICLAAFALAAAVQATPAQTIKVGVFGPMTGRRGGHGQQ